MQGVPRSLLLLLATALVLATSACGGDDEQASSAESTGPVETESTGPAEESTDEPVPEQGEADESFGGGIAMVDISGTGTAQDGAHSFPLGACVIDQAETVADKGVIVVGLDATRIFAINDTSGNFESDPGDTSLSLNVTGEAADLITHEQLSDVSLGTLEDGRLELSAALTAGGELSIKVDCELTP